MTTPTTRFEIGDLVRVPFPHVERAVLVARPALVIGHAVGPDAMLIWTVMITNQDRADWPGDIAIPHAQTLGLIIPSKIRTAKIATVETSQASPIGRLPDHILTAVQQRLSETLGL